MHSRNKEMALKQYKDILEKTYSFSEYIWCAWAVIYCIEKEVIESFPEKVDLIMALEEPIEYMSMNRDLFCLPDDELIQKYGWLKIYTSFDQPYTKEDFGVLRNQLNKKEVEQQFEDFSKVKEEFKDFCNSIEDQQLRLKSEIVHAYAFLKTDRIDVWRKVLFHRKEFYEYLASLKEGLNIEKVAAMHSSEIINFIEKEILPLDLPQRSENKILYHYHDKLVEILSNEEQIATIFKTLNKFDETLTKLQGVVACKGKVQGKVRIVRTSKDLHKVEKGDIFVAKYTFPSYTPTMIKCGALISDEGGITSHTAIIGREYNIPCIVGTKIATKVFKDGDLVEVDANTGVVTLLDKSLQESS